MNRTVIIELLGKDWTGMQAFLKESLYSDVPLLADINAKITSHPGKMLRPMVLLLMARAAGRISEDSIRYAVAVELLHNATLMHDDVTDNSSERRGAPTLASLIGPSAAVLVGDFWLARAVEAVMGTAHNNKIIKYFSKTLTDLAEGEMLQLEKAGTADTSEEDYFRIIYCKTASLFEAASISAAASVDASDELLEAARQYGRYLGIAFQIKDDILDYAGTPEMGKPVGVDLKERKITLPLLCAMENCPEREEEIRRKVREIDSHPEYCGEIAAFVREADGIRLAAAKLEEYVEMAVGTLVAFPDTPERKALSELAVYNAMRTI